MQVTLYERLFQRRDTTRTALVGFGANLPSAGLDLGETLLNARDALVGDGLSLVAFSRLYHTPAYPVGTGPDYMNAVAAFSVPQTMTAQQVLAHLHKVEATFGRTREARWGARVLDLDFLAFAEMVLPDPAIAQTTI